MVQRRPIGGDGPLFIGERLLAGGHGGGLVVSLDEELENLILETAHSVLRHRDLVLDGLVLLVSLDLHQLVLELRQTSLHDGQFFLERSTGVLIVRECLSRRVERQSPLGEPRLESSESPGQVADPLPALIGLGVEVLKVDQVLKVSEH